MLALVGLALATPCLTHGVAVGQVSDTGATLWARLAGPGTVRVEARPAAGGGRKAVVRVDAAVDPALDHTARVRLDALAPGTRYVLSVRAPGRCAPEEAVFTTAPRPDAPAAVRLAWGGDLGGQNTCRHATEEYPLLDRLAMAPPDIFVAVGDMVYADDRCTELSRYGYPQIPGPGPSTTLADFYAWWAYNRASPSSRRLYAATALLPVWDDHEATNDAGPADPELDPARTALVAWNPITPGAPLYRTERRGRHVEIFVLDTRSYRDANEAPDTAAAPKTMLGAAQRAWLVDAVTRSDATWKVIVSSVPLAIPTGRPGALDGWSALGGDTGYAREARALLEALHGGGARNLVFLTADVHFASAFFHRPVAADPDWTVIEAVSGPLQAGIFPKVDVDPALGSERWFFHGPASVEAVTTWEEARRWFNVGRLEVDEAGRLTLWWENAMGDTLGMRRFDPR